MWKRAYKNVEKRSFGGSGDETKGLWNSVLELVVERGRKGKNVRMLAESGMVRWRQEEVIGKGRSEGGEWEGAGGPGIGTSSQWKYGETTS
jgi:hypothetical protein